MKGSIPMTFFFHFICINSLLFLATAQDEAAAVLDGSGNALEVGSKYYIKQVVTSDNAGGGVTIGYSGAQRCPLTVFQQIIDVQNGVPCSFHPSNPNESIVRVSSSLNIKFETHVGCANSTVWRVGEYDEEEGFRPILIGGAQGEPGCNTLMNWFKIENGDNEGSYKLVFNPTDVCPSAAIGDNLGTFFREGKRPLALNGSALDVKFWKYSRFSRAIY